MHSKSAKDSRVCMSLTSIQRRTMIDDKYRQLDFSVDQARHQCTGAFYLGDDSKRMIRDRICELDVCSLRQRKYLRISKGDSHSVTVSG